MTLSEALDRACKFVDNFAGTCPEDMFNWEPSKWNCAEQCDSNQEVWKCWREYFLHAEIKE